MLTLPAWDNGFEFSLEMIWRGKMPTDHATFEPTHRIPKRIDAGALSGFSGADLQNEQSFLHALYRSRDYTVILWRVGLRAINQRSGGLKKIHKSAS